MERVDHATPDRAAAYDHQEDGNYLLACGVCQTAVHAADAREVRGQRLCIQCEADACMEVLSSLTERRGAKADAINRLRRYLDWAEKGLPSVPLESPPKPRLAAAREAPVRFIQVNARPDGSWPGGIP